MSVEEYLLKRVGQKIGVVRSGFPKEVLHTGDLVRVESGMAVIVDEKKREWAIPVDKILIVSPPDGEEGDRTAGFRGV